MTTPGSDEWVARFQQSNPVPQIVANIKGAAGRRKDWVRRDYEVITGASGIIATVGVPSANLPIE